MIARSLIALLGVGLFVWPCSAENPVTNGSFERLDANGIADDWSPMGDVSISSDTHSGKRALLLRRAADAERIIGLNRRWIGGEGGGNAMLSERKGGFSFWYKIPAAAGSSRIEFVVIPMSDEPKEVGGRRVIYALPVDHVGDGEWHTAAVAYDYTDLDDVKWIHVGARLRDAKCSLLLDDIEWVDSIGPYPSIKSIRLITPLDAKPGERVVDVVIANVGDETLTNAKVSLTAPDGIAIKGESEIAAPALKPDTIGKVKFLIEGPGKDGDELVVTLRTVERVAKARLRLEARIVIEHVRPDRSVLTIGEETVVRIIARNKGTAMGEIAAMLWPSSMGLEVIMDSATRMDIAPGASQESVCRLKAVTARSFERRFFADTIPNSSSPILSPNPICEFTIVEPYASQPRTKKLPNPWVGDDGALVWNGAKTRLWLPKTNFGYGVADLTRTVDGEFKTVARLSRLGRIVVQTKDGGSQTEYLFADKARADGDVLVLTRDWTDNDGATWKFVWRFAPNPRFDDMIDVSASATPDRDGQVLCFEAPMLRVGEGSFGGANDEAIFGGLEWLVEGEYSSSDLDIEEGHDHQVRYAPHPHMVTVPAMSLRRDGVTVGMLWDQKQTYHGDLDRPTAVFASPNRFEGQNNTLMGLFAPSMPEYVEMNEREAHTPLAVAAGETVSLGCVFYCGGEESDVLSTFDRWLALYGVPEPSPYPHGDSLADEAAFSAISLLDTGWMEDEQRWWSTKSPNPLRGKAVLPPSYLHDTVRCGELSSDPKIAERCRERVELVKSIAPNIIPVADDMGFDFRDGVSWLNGLRGAFGPLGSMDDDGGWRYRDRVENGGVHKGKDYGLLGKEGETAVGLCAIKAYQLLRVGRMTNDPEAKEAGFKALAFIDQFRVPRAAQVWECPLHTPDILASADAVEAYVEAYEITGEKKYLDKAVYWARTGIPFIYTWDTPGHEYLRYATIPIFGATWFRGSWFARPVQWNGMRYAFAVWKLSRHDDTLPWTTIADGITRSAMWQQRTAEGEDIAMWPDFINALDLSYSEGLMFQPRRIMQMIHALNGNQPAPVTLRLGSGDRVICVNACAALDQGKWKDETISFRAEWQAPQTGYLCVLNIKRPKSVLRDRKPLTELGELKGASWRYHEGLRALEIKTPNPGVHSYMIDGVRFEQAPIAPRRVGRMGFEFDRNAEGWTPAHDLADFGAGGGWLSMRTTGADPYLVRSALSVPTRGVKALRIRLRATGGDGMGEVFWQSNLAPSWSPERARKFAMPNDGKWHEVRVPLRGHPQWRGTITALRLDPTTAPGARVDVDWIRGE